MVRGSKRRWVNQLQVQQEPRRSSWVTRTIEGQEIENGENRKWIRGVHSAGLNYSWHPEHQWCTWSKGVKRECWLWCRWRRIVCFIADHTQQLALAGRSFRLSFIFTHPPSLVLPSSLLTMTVPSKHASMRALELPPPNLFSQTVLWSSWLNSTEVLKCEHDFSGVDCWSSALLWYEVLGRCPRHTILSYIELCIIIVNLGLYHLSLMSLSLAKTRRLSPSHEISTTSNPLVVQ
jgi:hypothetical protein